MPVDLRSGAFFLKLSRTFLNLACWVHGFNIRNIAQTLLDNCSRGKQIDIVIDTNPYL